MIAIVKPFAEGTSSRPCGIGPCDRDCGRTDWEDDVKHLFRVKFKESGEFIDDLWKNDPDHLESHLLISPSGRVFWLQWDGLKELTAEVEVHWTNSADGNGESGDAPE